LIVLPLPMTLVAMPPLEAEADWRSFDVRAAVCADADPAAAAATASTIVAISTDRWLDEFIF
jgi:hypothetical protein